MPVQNDARFSRSAANELRSMADRVPEIADDLREMADDLDDRPESQIRRLGTLLPASPFGRLFRRLRS